MKIFKKTKFRKKNKIIEKVNLSIVGKSKNVIINSLGLNSNFYEENDWYYILSSTWYCSYTVLYIEFENEIAVRKCVRTVYGRRWKISSSF